MDKSSSKKRKKTKKRSHSSSSSSEDENYKKKRRLKENKQEILPSKSDENFTHETEHREPDRGGDSDSETKKSSKVGKLKGRKGEYSCSESSSSSTLESERDRKRRRKLKKKERKKRKKEKRKKDKRSKREKCRKGKEDGSKLLETAVESEDLVSGPMPAPEQTKNRRPMVPMTKEEYEKQQSQVRRVFDPETGRHRLVKGDGEIIEEVVSYQRHKEINKLATVGDGTSFQKSLGLHKYSC